MTFEEMTPEQARKISDWYIPLLLKIGKLEERTKLAFPEGDRFRDQVMRTAEQVRQLRLMLNSIEERARRW